MAIRPPTLNHFRKFNGILHKTRLTSSTFRTMKESTIVNQKSIRLKKTMAVGSTGTGINVHGGDNRHIIPTVSAFEHEAFIDNRGVSFHRRSGGLHVMLNRLSKWLVAFTFGGLILLRHDGLALWATTGSVLNFVLSVALKRILRQERPVSEVCSGHGMPSSHAQTIFFTLVFVILSVVEWMGLNGLTVILGTVVLALGSYFSWLRVLLRYHTTGQVVVGTFVGSIFSVLWFWAWEAIVHRTYNSNLGVKIFLIVGVACYYLGFISYVLWYVIKK